MKYNAIIYLRIILLGTIMQILVAHVMAQPPCSDEVIMSTKGSWKKLTDGNVFPDPSFSKNQFPQVNKRIDNMQKLLQVAYPQPMGTEAGWYRNITGKAQVNAGPVPFSLNALFFHYYCSHENKIITEQETRGGETGTWFYVFSNQLHGWFAQPIKIYIIQKQPVFLLNKRIGEINGNALYEGIYNQTSNTGTNYSRAVLLTRPGHSPYLPVTQKQFLKAFLNYNEKRDPRLLAALEKNMKVLSVEEEEAEKTKQLAILERVTPPAKLARAKENFLRNYVTSAEYKASSITKTKNLQEEVLRPARELLKDSLKLDLSQAAILDFDNLLEFQEFTTEEKGGQQLVRLNPAYFNMSLPRYVPQLFIVYWKWTLSDPGNYWRDRIEKKFDFNGLKEMIDK